MIWILVAWVFGCGVVLGAAVMNYLHKRRRQWWRL